MSKKSDEKALEDMAADTLAGDLRDVMLTHIRAMETPWSKLSERQQQDKIDVVSKACDTIVRRAVFMLAARDMPHISASISKFTVKEGIKAELVAASSAANIEKMAEFQNEPALLVFASPEAYLGERQEAKPDPDQPELPVVKEDADESGDGPAETPPDPEAEDPDLSPYDQGRGAKAAGLDISHNPFKARTADHKQWLEGFNSTDADADAPELEDA